MGWLVWCILILIFIGLLTSWWYVLLLIVVFFLFSIFIIIYSDARIDSRIREPRDNSMPHLQKVKREIEERKRKEAEGTKTSDGIRDAAAIAGGAALYHHLTKGHNHDDAKDDINRDMDLWDADPDDLYDAGIADSHYDIDNSQYYDNDSYDDIAAYDDFIASMDDV